MRPRATPWGRDRATPLSGAIRCHMTPRLGGGRSRHSFFSRSTRAGRFIEDNHSGMKEIKESGFAAFLVRIVPYPPSERAA